MKNIEKIANIKTAQDLKNYCASIHDGSHHCVHCELASRICFETEKPLDIIAKIQLLPEMITFKRKEKLEKLLSHP